MITVVIESPYAGDVEANVEYARLCLKHSLDLGEAPFASHLLYPQVLDDDNPDERDQGINGQLAWIDLCRRIAVYTDRGISPGMQKAIDYAESRGHTIWWRTLVFRGSEV